MLKKVSLYFWTIKHLKPVQIWYRLYYRMQSLFKPQGSFPYKNCKEISFLYLPNALSKPISLKGNSFTFLNRSKSFEKCVDWSFNNYGKLWVYNLNYFDFLNQPSLSKEEGLFYINDFIDQIRSNDKGLEPYPISLRGINWIKFLSYYQIKDQRINGSLYGQYKLLESRIEYHILGNHLMENACSLLFGGVYFNDKNFLKKAFTIIDKQLSEQILSDGCHFERSAMYHKIILERLLDSFNLLINNSVQIKDNKIVKKIRKKLALMLGWMQNVRFSNGDMPNVNDYVEGIAASTDDLLNYAESLGIEIKKKPLSISGYRKYKLNELEIFIDIGKIGPDYQPAHAHSDTFSFILHSQGKQIIIDTGTSTYEAGTRRNLERCTYAHNTVQLSNVDQSQVWSSFRVGRRARPYDIEEGEKILKASHNGYHHLGITHTREWIFTPKEIIIKDFMSGVDSQYSFACLHFPSNTKPIRKSESVFQAANIIIYLGGAKSSEIKPWKYATDFNVLEEGYKIETVFKKKLKTQIRNYH